MKTVNKIKLNQSMPMSKKIIVEFKDENGNIKRGILNANNGHCVIVIVGTERIRMSRKEITFVKN